MALPAPGMPQGPEMSPHGMAPFQGMRPQQGSSPGLSHHQGMSGQGMSGQGMTPHAMSPQGYGPPQGMPQGRGYGPAQGQGMAPRAPSVPDYAGDLPYANTLLPFAAAQVASDGMAGAYGPRPSSPGFDQMAGEPNAPYGMHDAQMQRGGMGAGHAQPHPHAQQAMGFPPQGHAMQGMEAQPPQYGMAQQGMMGYGDQGMTPQGMGQQGMMGQGMPGTMGQQGHGMAPHQGTHAGMQGGMDMQGQGPSGPQGMQGMQGMPAAQGPGSRSAAPDRTLAFVAAGVGLGLIICAVVYALASMRPG